MPATTQRRRGAADEALRLRLSALCLACGGPACYDRPLEAALSLGLRLAAEAPGLAVAMCRGKVHGREHWWLAAGEGQVLDPTAGRFGREPRAEEYDAAEACPVDFAAAADRAGLSRQGGRG